MENPYCKICELDKCLGNLCPLLNQRPDGKGATTNDDVEQEKLINEWQKGKLPDDLTVNDIRNSTQK